MSPVTLPGDLVSHVAGPLLRRGCPVVSVAARSDMYGRPGLGMLLPTGTVTVAGPGGLAAAVTWDDPGDREVLSMDKIALDLSDPAGMDRAARWRLEHEGIACGPTSPSLIQVRGLDNIAHWGLRYSDPVWEWKVLVFRDPTIAALTDPAEALRAACLAAVGRTT